MRVLVLLVVVSCGGLDGRARDPGAVSGVFLPDPSTGAGEPDAPRLDLPQWPDLPADTSSSGEASTSTGGEDGSSGSTGQGTTSEASTGADASTGSTGEDSTSSSSSTGQGPEPSGCPCAPGIDNFCDLPPSTCPPTAPGGYCDPDGDGAYLDGDFNAGFLDWKAECG